MRREVL